MARSKVNTGDVFGRLTVAREWGRTKGGKIKWMCKCECGNTSVVQTSNLTGCTSKSCGCLRRDRLLTHGKTYSRAYRAWAAMLSRCTNSNNAEYHNYGGRGVYVCDEWNPKEGGTFEAFYECMGDPANGLSLDKDVKGGIGCLVYSPETASWQTSVEQSRTRRVSSDTRYLCLNGITKRLIDWAKEFNINKKTIYSRLKYGWSVHEALKTPPGGDRTQFAAS